MKTAIIGVGELGTALVKVLSGHGEVGLWDIDPAKTPSRVSLEDAVRSTSIIFLCVPSFAIRDAVKLCLAAIAPSVAAPAIISLAKGIEANDKKLMDEVLAEVMPTDHRWGVLGGPMLSAELSAEKPCAAVIASSDATVSREVKDVFEGTNLKIETSDDTHGVVLGGVLKNIYTLAMGIAVELTWGDDEMGWLASRAMEEMLAIGKMLGAQEVTIHGTACFADFLATAYSATSRNRETGIALVNGEISEIKGEGILSLPSLITRIGDISSLPILAALEKIIEDRENPTEIFTGLISHNQ